MIEIGKINCLKVIRKTDLGYMVSDEKEEILLHYKEAERELEINQMVHVYIYTDSKNRKTATMNEALLTLDTVHRQGFRCLWSQKFHPQTSTRQRRPGAPAAAIHKLPWLPWSWDKPSGPPCKRHETP